MMAPDDTNKNKRPNHGNGSSSSFTSSTSKEVATEEGRNKKQKKSNSSNENGVSVLMKQTENNKTPTAGYIHVRARRGQATDSHSLAERVRREKISERMKMLQRLVPGCDQVTGKALVLDEIINYVQSLQNQVQFLTMKLASLNPLLCDFTTKQDTLMASLINPRLINSTALPLPSMPQPQCSSSNNQAINFGDDDYYLLNDSVSVFLQAQNTSSNAFSSEDASIQIWDVEDQRQKLIDLYESNNNFCSFP